MFTQLFWKNDYECNCMDGCVHVNYIGVFSKVKVPVCIPPAICEFLHFATIDMVSFVTLALLVGYEDFHLLIHTTKFS